jgi:hypothetical protein
VEVSGFWLQDESIINASAKIIVDKLIFLFIANWVIDFGAKHKIFLIYMNIFSIKTKCYDRATKILVIFIKKNLHDYKNSHIFVSED